MKKKYALELEIYTEFRFFIIRMINEGFTFRHETNHFNIRYILEKNFVHSFTIDDYLQGNTVSKEYNPKEYFEFIESNIKDREKGI